MSERRACHYARKLVGARCDDLAVLRGRFLGSFTGMDSTDVIALYHQLRERMRVDWQRDLPIYELLFDRWERAESLGFGEGASIYHSAMVYGEVKVGERTWIGPYTILDGSGGLTIGRNCSISSGVQIYTHDSVQWAVTEGEADYEHAEVVIGDGCYIGPLTVVAMGVTIGAHTVVGACSFVGSDLPENVVAAGAPCRIIRERTQT